MATFAASAETKRVWRWLTWSVTWWTWCYSTIDPEQWSCTQPQPCHCSVSPLLHSIAIEGTELMSLDKCAHNRLHPNKEDGVCPSAPSAPPGLACSGQTGHWRSASIATVNARVVGRCCAPTVCCWCQCCQCWRQCCQSRGDVWDLKCVPSMAASESQSLRERTDRQSACGPGMAAVAHCRHRRTCFLSALRCCLFVSQSVSAGVSGEDILDGILWHSMTYCMAYIGSVVRTSTVEWQEWSHTMP